MKSLQITLMLSRLIPVDLQSSATSEDDMSTSTISWENPQSLVKHCLF
jgi:hypothetical protein